MSSEEPAIDEVESPAAARKALDDRLKTELKESERVLDQRLNYTFLTQTFLFGAEAVTAQTVQNNSSLDLVVQCLRFALPLLGVLLCFLMFLILNPVFEKQHGILLAIQPFPMGRTSPAQRKLLEIEERDFKETARLRKVTHNVYRAILAAFAFVWLAVFFLAIVDQVRDL